MNKEALSRRIVGSTAKFLKKNSTVILAVMGTVGVCATVYTTIKAVPRAQKRLEDAKNESKEELSTLDKIEAVAPAYILPVSIAASTIGCIISSAVISVKQQKSLIAAYGMASTYFGRYRGKLIEKYGEEVDIEIRDELARECCDMHLKGLDYPDQKAIWYDELSGNTIVAYEREIMDAEYHMNRNFTMRGYASLNEFYEFVGMPLTKAGDCLGWSSSDGYYWIDFEHRRVDNQDDNGMPIYAIVFNFCPDADYLQDWESPVESLPWDAPIELEVYEEDEK